MTVGSSVQSLITIAVLLMGCTTSQQTTKPVAPASSPEAAVTLGDGQENWIKLDGLKRDGKTFTVPEVLIAKDGWLVIHRFKDGKPFGDDYVAATYISRGSNLDVPISLPDEPAPGTPFLIMLHSDVNANQQFDFVFVDERNVLDKAVFEGSTMIAQIFKAP